VQHEWRLKAYIFQLLNLTRQDAHVLIIMLALQLIQHCRTILAARIRRRGAERLVASPYAIATPARIQIASAAIRRAGVCGEAGVSGGRGVPVATRAAVG
jgi:hypothetical protein